LAISGIEVGVGSGDVGEEVTLACVPTFSLSSITSVEIRAGLSSLGVRVACAWLQPKRVIAMSPADRELWRDFIY
jgi:hypothetical protein